jgi:hypothetical protein
MRQGKVCVRLSSRSAEREPRGFITQSQLKSYLVTNTMFSHEIDSFKNKIQFVFFFHLSAITEI